MKFLIASLALIAVATAQQQHETEQPPIAILRQAQDVSPDGSYSYNYETENGIAVSESGSPSGPIDSNGQASVAAQGQYQYTAPDGTPIRVTYTADENGFVAQGDHLPVAPPVPEAILRSLEWNAAHPDETDDSQPQQHNQRF